LELLKYGKTHISNLPIIKAPRKQKEAPWKNKIIDVLMTTTEARSVNFLQVGELTTVPTQLISQNNRKISTLSPSKTGRLYSY
jgi:hypothetical protein